jgi:hypothetical protein
MLADISTLAAMHSLTEQTSYVIGRLGGQTGRVSPEKLHQDRSNQP